MHYTSNERHMFSPSIDIYGNENTTKTLKWCAKMYFFNFYFSILHISSNNRPGNLRVCIHVDNIHPEGTVSQMFDLGLSFNFMSKND